MKEEGIILKIAREKWSLIANGVILNDANHHREDRHGDYVAALGRICHWMRAGDNADERE